ncbi:MAG: 2-hydroxyacid dehydrogenase [Patescibacteria group bacterium UBA2103]
MGIVYVTRHIPEVGIDLLKDAGHEVIVSKKDGVLEKGELLKELSSRPFDAVLCLLTDAIDAEVFDTVPSAKVFSNYAVGFNNIDIDEAKKRGITVTNTPGVLSDTVAEYTFSLMLSLLHRIPEGDRFVRRGKYEGWAPELLLGDDIKGKVIGILGAGRIGSSVAKCAACFGASVIYNDVVRNNAFEKETGAVFKDIDDVFKEADIVSVHVPLLDSTHHFVSKERLEMMKKDAYLINTSRGAVVDERALIDHLRAKKIKGAAIDVFEYEPKLTPGAVELDNLIVTPHIASATHKVREEMAILAAENVINFLKGKVPKHVVS